MAHVQQSSHSTETPLVYRRTPRTLLSMSALELALLYWRHQMNNLYLDEVDSLELYWLISYKFTCDDIFHAPNNIVKMINEHINSLGISLSNWMDDTPLSFIYADGDYKTKALVNVLKNIVIEPCDPIIDVKTARNLINDDTVHPLDQFKIACMYSLEADIKRLWPLVSDDIAIPSNRREYDPKFHYWCSRMENELDDIRDDEEDSTEFRLMSVYYNPLCKYWTDIEFYWDKLEAHEQLSDSTLDTIFKKDVNVTHYVLSKLSRAQLDHVLARRPSHILKNLSKFDYTFEFALETWSFMKNLITQEQFFNILYELWKKSYCSYERDFADVLLYKIWLESPPDFKNYVLFNHVEQFFDDLKTLNTLCDYGSDLRFLRCLLTNTRFEVRNELWRRNWRKFIELATLDELDKFLKLCFENELDIAEFKSNVMLDFDQLCDFFKKFIRFGFSREVIEYLRYCTSNENRFVQLKRQIIKSVLLNEYAFDRPHSMNEFLINFMDCNYLAFDFPPEVVSREECKEFLTQFENTSPTIFCAEDFKELYTLYNLPAFLQMLDESAFSDANTVLDTVLSSNRKYTISVKQQIREFFLRGLGSEDYPINRMREWKEILKCCDLNEQQLRRDLPVDRIFERLVTDVIRAIPDQSKRNLPDDAWSNVADNFKFPYRYLMNFLRWYFENDADRMYKLSQIDDYCCANKIRKMLREPNDSIFLDVVNFYFENDVEKIEQFRSRVIDK